MRIKEILLWIVSLNMPTPLVIVAWCLHKILYHMGEGLPRGHCNRWVYRNHGDHIDGDCWGDFWWGEGKIPH
jgi:hypothetical protein